MDPGDVPVALFAYRRPAELAQTLGGLERAGFRRIIAFSEAPGSQAERPLVEEVRELLAGVSWAEVDVVERDEQLGLSRSIRRGLDEVFAREERAVVIEDDIAVAPEFGPYVAAALERYADEGRVAGITGHRMPFSRRWLRGHPYDAFMLPRFFGWGWASWRRAWRTFDFDRDRLLERFRSGSVRVEAGGADLAWMLRRTLVDRSLIGGWDVDCAANVLLNDQLFVCPTWNMVENRGLGTGTHPQSPRWTLRFEQEHRPADLDQVRWPPVEVAPRVAKGFQIFTENPRGWTLRRLVPRPLRNVARRMRRTYEL
jgi:hypothetical protein